MKKLIFLICLCLCLGSVAAMSESFEEEPLLEDAFEATMAQSSSEDEEEHEYEDEEETSEAEGSLPDDDDTSEDSPRDIEDISEHQSDVEAETPEHENTDDSEAFGGRSAPKGDESHIENGETTSEGDEAPEDSEDQAEGPLPFEDAAEGPLPPEENDSLEGAEAWLYIDGEPYGGDIEDIIDMLEGDETVYIATSHTLHLRDVSLYTLAGVQFRPDPEVFDEDCVVALYAERPIDEEYTPEADLSGVSEGDYGDLYLRVEAGGRWFAAAAAATDGTAAEGPLPEEEEESEEKEIAITVKPASFPTGVWVNKQPTFSLSGIPEGEKWNYAALIYDQRFIPLEGDEYVPVEQGKYTLRFVIQDELGDIRAASDNIRVWFDWTPPELNVEPVEDENYAIDISATDGLSGVAALSVDAGQHWFNFDDTDTYRYTASSKRTLIPGTIRVRDEAGNIFKSKEPYELTKKEKEEEDEAEAQKTASASPKPTKLPHAKDNGEDADPYALKLKLPNEPMRQLILGGKAKNLTLMVERFGEQAGRTPASFTGALTRWLSDGTDADAKLDPDTLILDAALDLDMEEPAINCEWHFNGEVCKELADAGIAYLAFRVGEDMSVVPTQGFTGGSKYTELKMLGVSTRKFDYTLTMKLDTDPGHMTVMTDNDFCQDCDMDLSVVVQNMSYLLSTSVKSPMYYFDVYLGRDDMLEYPFGAYDPVEF